jgi:hypothetical protein
MARIGFAIACAIAGCAPPDGGSPMPDLAQPLAPALRFFTRADPNDAWATRSTCG